MKNLFKQLFAFAFVIVSLLNVYNCQPTEVPNKISYPMKPKNFELNRKENLSLSQEEWKNQLAPEVYHILREKGTEAPNSGQYNTLDKLGEYYCAGCGNHLFRSTQKFASTCGWPSFFEAEKSAVEYKTDSSYGMNRVEVLCKKCGGHLGHVFDDGPEPTGKRYCMNSLSLHFVAK